MRSGPRLHRANERATPLVGGVRTIVLGSLLMLAACTGASAGRAPVPARGAPLRVAQFSALVDSMVLAPAFRNAHWGVLIVDPQTGDTLYSHNAAKLFMPASNQKLITGATVLTQLGPDYRFRTQFSSNGRIADGVLIGDLVVMPSGDPTFSDTMWNGGSSQCISRDDRFAHCPRRAPHLWLAPARQHAVHRCAVRIRMGTR